MEKERRRREDGKRSIWKRGMGGRRRRRRQGEI